MEERLITWKSKGRGTGVNEPLWDADLKGSETGLGMALILKGGMKMSKMLRITMVTGLIVAVLMIASGTLVGAADPITYQPTYAGGITVDGLTGDWDLVNDFFATFHNAGETSNPPVGDLYLRYDCSTETLYALMLTRGETIDTSDPAGEIWLKVNGAKIANGTQGAFVYDNSDVVGWEVSASLSCGEYMFEAHYNAEPNADTRSTGRGEDEIPLNVYCGSITIVKDTICGANCPDDTGDFGYDFLHVGNPPAVEFWLDDPETDDGDGITNSETFNNLEFGTYEVTEDVFPHVRWYIQDIYCNVPVLIGSDGDFDPGDDTVRVDVLCEDVVCTFVNEDPGTTDVGIASLAASSGAGGLAALLGMAGLLGTAAAGLRAKRRS
jgi:hypothetical protein